MPFFLKKNSEKPSHVAFDANVSLHANLTFMLPFCVSAHADLYLVPTRLIDSRLGLFVSGGTGAGGVWGERGRHSPGSPGASARRVP